jgi:hypothetical protein
VTGNGGGAEERRKGVTYDFRMVHQPLRHNLRRSELITTNEDVHMGRIFRQIFSSQEEISLASTTMKVWNPLTGSLLRGRIAASDDRQRLLSEDRHGTVADCAGADPALPVLVFAG